MKQRDLVKLFEKAGLNLKDTVVAMTYTGVALTRN